MTPTESHRPLEPLQVSIAQAAQMLCYSTRTIYVLLQRGELKSVGTGRLRRIAVAELRRWQHQNEG